MHDRPLLRLLAVIQRELGADDARVEIGGRDPSSAEVVWVRLPDERRIVVTFDQGLSDRGAMRERLQSLVDAFIATVATPEVEAVRTRRGLTRSLLQAELVSLVDRAAARVALVIDGASPVLWGCSMGGHEAQGDIGELVVLDGIRRRLQGLGLEAGALLAAEVGSMRGALEAVCAESGLVAEAVAASLRGGVGAASESWQDRLLMARAVAELRGGASSTVSGRSRVSSNEAEFGYVARAFGAAYWLIVVYGGPFSDLQAEGALARSLPRVERLVLALPPSDLPPGGGKVMRMPKKPTK